VKRRALLLSLWALGCARKARESVVERAEFGVFFGGQVQKLREIPKELDPARQRHGFRLTFGAPLSQRIDVKWEISLPVPEKGGPRPAIVGQSSVPPGQTGLDVPLTFRPSDPLGAWHAKVTAAGDVVLDWDFVVVAPPPPPKSAPKPLAPRAPGSAPPSL
jgi:hypothetical protein